MLKHCTSKTRERINEIIFKEENGQLVLLFEELLSQTFSAWARYLLCYCVWKELDCF